MNIFLRVCACVLTVAALDGASAEELQGTAYSITFRSEPPAAAGRAPARPSYPSYTRPLPARPAMAPAASASYSLFASSVQKVIAQAGYDPQLRGYFFQLPMNLELPAGPVCLVLKDPRGISVPVRDERRGDDGYAFRNTLWENEYGRVRELALRRSALRDLLSEQKNAQSEIDAVFPGGSAPAICVAPPAIPEPPKPAGALTNDEAKDLAGGICASKWIERLGSIQDAERLYRDAGLAADWLARDRAEAVAKAFTGLRIAVSDEELDRIKLGARRGPGYLEHEESVYRLKERSALCKADVPRQALAAGQRWEDSKQAARDAPMLAVKSCISRQERVKELQRRQADSPVREAELRKRIAQLESAEPSASEATRVDSVACKEF